MGHHSNNKKYNCNPYPLWRHEISFVLCANAQNLGPFKIVGN